jgi:transposase
VDGSAAIEQLRAVLAARDAEFAAREADLAARDADLAAAHVRYAELEGQVAKLTETVRVLQELLGRNSGNSYKPPSSDPPGTRAKVQKRKLKGGRRGGQKGHRGSHRMLVPVEQVNEIVHLYPSDCESCWEPLPKTPDALARRYQYTELKPLAVHVTEYQRHAVACVAVSRRGRRTTGRSSRASRSARA